MKINFQFKTKSFCQLTRHLNLTLLIIAVIILSYLSYFLYYNVFLALPKIEKINSLKSDGIFAGEIQTDLYQKILEQLKQKQQGGNIDFKEMRDPFKPYQTKEE